MQKDFEVLPNLFLQHSANLGNKESCNPWPTQTWVGFNITIQKGEKLCQRLNFTSCLFAVAATFVFFQIRDNRKVRTPFYN
jgi:hypothetical protein